MFNTNLVFRKAITAIISDKEQKKILVGLKEWVKDLPNATNMIRNEKWGWWRKVKKNYPGLTVKDVEKQLVMPVKESLSFLNAIVEKHNIGMATEALQIGDEAYLQ